MRATETTEIGGFFHCAASFICFAELTEVTSSQSPTHVSESFLDKTKNLRHHSIAGLPDEYVAKFQAIRVKSNPTKKERVIFWLQRFDPRSYPMIMHLDLSIRFAGMRIVDGDFVRSFGAIHPESRFAMTWNAIHGILLFFL